MALSTQYGVDGGVEMTSPSAAIPAPTIAGPPGQSTVVWMQKPTTISGCPPGLEYLTQLDQILVHQQVELLEAFTAYEGTNKYQVKNSLGQQIFFAYEESDLLARQCCEGERGFTMHIVDNMQQEVMRVVREFQCCAGCCWCADCSKNCAYTIQIESPPGHTIGYVRQRTSFVKPCFDILDDNEEALVKIRGPFWTCQTVCCTDDVDFALMNSDESEQIGKISKQWAGFAKEYYTKADNFGIQFPMNLEVKTKALLLGALFLIDFIFYEESDGGNHNLMLN